MNPDQIMSAFIDSHVATIEPLAREAALAGWEFQTTSSESAKAQVTELTGRIRKVYSDPEKFALLKSLPADQLADPRVARQHTLLTREFLSSQMTDAVIEEMTALEVDIEESYNTYRAIVNGKPVSDNEIDDILMTSDDVVLRHAAWTGSKGVGAHVADRVLTLIRMRNREAQKLGFANYYAMGLEMQELEETRLFAILDDLAERSEPLWNSYRSELDTELAARFGVLVSEIRPWHHANRFFQSPGNGEADLDRFFADKDIAELTGTFFAAIGLPVEDLLQKADLYEREGKCQHAFCMDVDRKGDIRVLCNNRPNERWMGTTLHEFGHAVYDKFNDPELPFLLRGPAHTLTTESIALYMGRLNKDARWLRIYAGVEATEAERIAAMAKREVRDYLLVFMHWCLVMTNFERGMYTDPDQDLDALWWSLVKKYQKIELPESERPPHAWASKIHLASAPVYYQNYQLGEMVASQLLHHIETVVLAGEPADASVTSPKVGAYMIERLFVPGAIRSWEQWLEHATSETLNPDYFVKQLADG